MPALGVHKAAPRYAMRHPHPPASRSFGASQQQQRSSSGRLSNAAPRAANIAQQPAARAAHCGRPTRGTAAWPRATAPLPHVMHVVHVGYPPHACKQAVHASTHVRMHTHTAAHSASSILGVQRAHVRTTSVPLGSKIPPSALPHASEAEGAGREGLSSSTSLLMLSAPGRGKANVHQAHKPAPPQPRRCPSPAAGATWASASTGAYSGAGGLSNPRPRLCAHTGGGPVCTGGGAQAGP